MNERPVRLFPDSNVIAGGVIAAWGLNKAVLSLCAAGICKMVLADIVKEEVEENLLFRAEELGGKEADRFLESYHRLINLSRPERVRIPDPIRIKSNRHLIRHEADVAVLLSAIDSKPDWLLTNNVKHFTSEVARHTGLRIATPFEFFRTMSRSTG